MSTPAVNTELDADRIQFLTNTVVTSLSQIPEVTPQEAVASFLTAIMICFKGPEFEIAEHQRFIRQASEWMTMYWAPTKERLN